MAKLYHQANAPPHEDICEPSCKFLIPVATLIEHTKDPNSEACTNSKFLDPSCRAVLRALPASSRSWFQHNKRCASSVEASSCSVLQLGHSLTYLILAACCSLSCTHLLESHHNATLHQTGIMRPRICLRGLRLISNFIHASPGSWRIWPCTDGDTC